MGIAGIAAGQKRVVLSLLCAAWMPILLLCLCKNFIVKKLSGLGLTAVIILKFYTYDIEISSLC